MMMINHFAGIILISLNGSGMLESGKWSQIGWLQAALIPLGNHHRSLFELEIVEINIPNERAVIMKSMLESE
jgi:hypothetical protein